MRICDRLIRHTPIHFISASMYWNKKKQARIVAFIQYFIFTSFIFVCIYFVELGKYCRKTKYSRTKFSKCTTSMEFRTIWRSNMARTNNFCRIINTTCIRTTKLFIILICYAGKRKKILIHFQNAQKNEFI